MLPHAVIAKLETIKSKEFHYFNKNEQIFPKKFSNLKTIMFIIVKEKKRQLKTIVKMTKRNIYLHVIS